MAASGNVRYSQIRSGDRQGNGSKVQMFGSGSPTSGNAAVFDANGNIVDFGSPPGSQGTSLFGISLTPPELTNFSTWVNQGSASISEVDGGLILIGGSDASFNIHARVRTVSIPYTFTMGFIGQLSNATNDQFGIVIRQSSDGKMITWGPHEDDIVRWVSFRMTNATTYGGTTDVNYLLACHQPMIWLRAANNSTTRTLEISTNMGQNWRVIGSQAAGTHLTEDQVGFFVNGADVQCFAVHWSIA